VDLEPADAIVAEIAIAARTPALSMLAPALRQATRDRRRHVMDGVLRIEPPAEALD
jgi:hypothetical protein